MAAGLAVAEVTLRTDAAFGVIEQMASRGDVIVGAGTVTSRDQVRQAAASGATFLVSPGLSEEVLDASAELGLVTVPGVATASDLMRALHLGVRTVKLFPAGVVGGPAAVDALAAPFPQMRFVPTGRVTARNAEAYLSHRQVLAVGGSWMVPRPLLAANAFDQIRQLVHDAVTLTAGDGEVVAPQ